MLNEQKMGLAASLISGWPVRVETSLPKYEPQPGYAPSPATSVQKTGDSFVIRLPIAAGSEDTIVETLVYCMGRVSNWFTDERDNVSEGTRVASALAWKQHLFGEIDLYGFHGSEAIEHLIRHGEQLARARLATQRGYGDGADLEF